MKRITIIGLLAISILAAAPWQQFGPPGFTVAALARVPGIAGDIFAVTAGWPALVFYSSDGGTSWTVRDSIRDRVVDVLVHPTQTQTMFAGGMNGRVWRSTDAGRSWAVFGTLAGSPTLRRLAFRPGQPLVMLAAAEIPASGNEVGLGIYTSSNGGAAWNGTWLDTGRVVSAVLLDPDPLRPERIYLGGSINGLPRLFTSGDGGGNWREITGTITGTCAWAAAPSLVDSGTILCATDDGIWRTTNGGTSWLRAKSVPAWSVEFAPASPFRAYAGSDNLVYRSTDHGVSWFADSTTFAGTATRLLGINPLDGLDVYAGNGRGVFRTTNGGYNWTERTTALGRLTVPFLYFHPVTPDSVFTCPPGHGLLASGDRGDNWQLLPGFAGAGFSTGIALNPNALDTLVAVTVNDQWLHMTSDRGDSWTRQSIETGFSGRGVAFHPAGPDTIYAWGSLDLPGEPGRFGFWRSINRGYNWTRNYSPGTAGCCRGFRFAADGDSLFLWGAVDGQARVYLSLNHGASWLDRSTGLQGSDARDLKTAPGSNRTSYLCATDAGVFRTINGGGTWTDLGLSGVTAVLADTADPDVIFAGTDTQGVWSTTNSGAYWERDTIGLEHRSVTLLLRHPVDAAAVYCGTEGGNLYGRGVIAIHEPAPAPRVRSLDVVPNVIRAGATVRLGSRERTVFELFGADGRRAAEPVVLDPAPAILQWRRPAGLAAGVYLLRARSAGTERYARIVLVD